MNLPRAWSPTPDITVTSLAISLTLFIWSSMKPVTIKSLAFKSLCFSATKFVSKSVSATSSSSSSAAWKKRCVINTRWTISGQSTTWYRVLWKHSEDTSNLDSQARQWHTSLSNHRAFLCSRKISRRVRAPRGASAWSMIRIPVALRRLCQSILPGCCDLII